jgi:signal transduction histidine kinase
LARLDPVADSDTLAGRVNLRETVDQMIVELGPAAFDKNIEINADYRCDGVIRGNRDMLSIMVRNLLTNAVRYTPESGSVTVRLQEEDGAVEVIVTDSGPGIAEQERSRVFERFYRQLGTQVAGTGLGLSIVARVAELHRAGISLDRGELGGLEVRVRFRKTSQSDPS